MKQNKHNFLLESVWNVSKFLSCPWTMMLIFRKTYLTPCCWHSFLARFLSVTRSKQWIRLCCWWEMLNLIVCLFESNQFVRNTETPIKESCCPTVLHFSLRLSCCAHGIPKIWTVKKNCWRMKRTRRVSYSIKNPGDASPCFHGKNTGWNVESSSR
jgi:hypothetical protein